MFKSCLEMVNGAEGKIHCYKKIIKTCDELHDGNGH